MAIWLTGSAASPSMVMLLVSGGEPFCSAGDGIFGWGEPHAEMTRAAAPAAHTFRFMGKH